MIVVVMLVLLAFVPGCSPSNSNADASSVGDQAANTTPASGAIAVQNSKVEVRDLQRTVEAVGSLDPNEEIIVSNQVEGLVSKVFFARFRT